MFINKQVSVMKSRWIKIGIVTLLMAPAAVYAQSRESVRSSSPYNGSAGRVSDKEKQKAAAEKFNGQRPAQPMQQNSQKRKQPIQGQTENGNRIKRPQSTTSK